MCNDAFVKIVGNASIETAVVTFDDVDMPCHENSRLHFSAMLAWLLFKAAQNALM